MGSKTRCGFNSAEPCNEWEADRGREAMRHASVANEEDFEHDVAKGRVWNATMPRTQLRHCLPVRQRHRFPVPHFLCLNVPHYFFHCYRHDHQYQYYCLGTARVRIHWFGSTGPSTFKSIPVVTSLRGTCAWPRGSREEQQMQVNATNSTDLT
ncbi:hypothetical protein BC826DRAFT_94790 [Russula brevipes]|nr:hypothetical protein BC826DRAFT_94790 [Russula brevipes]